MPELQSDSPINKLLVLGRGVEQDGSVLYDSPISGDSYDIALAAGNYASAHPGQIASIVFSGGHTFVLEADESRIPEGSEAEGMRDVVTRNFDLGATTLISETDSLTTYGNFLNITDFFHSSDTIGIPILPDHAKRALKIGHQVVPELTFRTLPAHNPVRTHENQSSRVSDLAAGVLYGIAMAGVRRGDRATFRRRDLAVQRQVLRALRFKNSLAANFQMVEGH